MIKQKNDCPYFFVVNRRPVSAAVPDSACAPRLKSCLQLGQTCHGGGAWTFTVKNGNIKEYEVIHSKYKVWYRTIHTS